MYILLTLFIALAYARAPLLTQDHPERIDGQYIVIYHPTVSDLVQAKHQAALGKSVFASYNITKDFMGYAATLDGEQLEFVLEDPAVKEVHFDHVVHAYGTEQTCDSAQSNVRSWGICRVSHYGAITTGALNTFRWNSGQSGTGVDVYVIDTGIRLTHQEFEGRAIWGANYVDSLRSDDNGHGTHCAGTIGGVTIGVARNCRLVAVRVLNGAGSGTNTGVINGINYCANNARTRGVPSVASMSLGGGYSAAMNNAVAALVSAGVTTAVAAGNDAASACNYSPASTPTAITVGATSTDASNRDIISSFSNYGTCVHVFAPGSNIYSCGISSNTAYATMSGTSMACPHAAGLAAVILHRSPTLTPQRVKDEMLNNANWDLIVNTKGTANALIYNGC